MVEARRPKQEDPGWTKRRLKLFSRSVEVSHNLVCFAESRAELVLRGFPVERVELSLDAEGARHRCQARVETPTNRALAHFEDASPRGAILGALRRAERSLGRAVERRRRRQRRLRTVAGIGLAATLGVVACAGAARANLPPDHRAMVLFVHLTGGEPDADRLPPTTSWRQAPLELSLPLFPLPTVLETPELRLRWHGVIPPRTEGLPTLLQPMRPERP